jgi:alpha-L-rhamnosidase
LNRRELLKSATAASIGLSALRAGSQTLRPATPADPAGLEPSPDLPNRFVRKADECKPSLRSERCPLKSEVVPVANSHAYLRWEMQPVGDARSIEKKLLKPGDTVYLDFGKHVTGFLHFDLSAIGINIDSPARLRLTFGEVPGDVAESFYPYKGSLTEAWLPDEVVNLDPLPLSFVTARRHAFRYVKLDVVSLSKKFAIRLSNCSVESVTSATNEVPPLPPGKSPLIVDVDRVALNTLRDCMQTVFEDGPRRDQRLWIGDFRLQALASYVTYRNIDLVKRCLYLLAAYPQDDGMLSACVFEKPFPRRAGDVILDYAAIFNVALLEYLEQTGDLATVRDLWPTALRQIDLISKFVNEQGLFVDPHTLWIFIDWETSLHRDAATQGVIICSLRATIALAENLGERDVQSRLAGLLSKMISTAKDAFFDPRQALFVSGPDRQISWASQAWLTLADVLPRAESANILRTAAKHPKIVHPSTPYLYHYVVEAMVHCGLREEANEVIASYWGGMVQRGADTFWEVYDPADSKASPYDDVHINSFCHAWSCTPTYFLRKPSIVKTDSA